jgi:hypothetical protein
MILEDRYHLSPRLVFVHYTLLLYNQLSLSLSLSLSSACLLDIFFTLIEKF